MKSISISDLSINFVTLINQLVRDLYTSQKKTKIYPHGHQVINKILEIPYGAFQKIFKFKKSLIIEAVDDRLFVEGIRLQNNESTREFSKKMVISRSKNIVFADSLTLDEMYKTIDFLFKSESLGNDFSNILISNDINSVTVNMENPIRLFGFNDYIGDEGSTHAITSNRIKDILQADFKIGIQSLVGLSILDSGLIKDFKYDIRIEAITALMDELIMEVELETIISGFEDFLRANKNYLEKASENINIAVKKFIASIGYYHDKAKAALGFQQAFIEAGFKKEDYTIFFDDISAASLQAIDAAEDFDESLETGRIDSKYTGDFSKTVHMLISGKVWKPIEQLMDSICIQASSENEENARTAFVLLRDLTNRILTEASGEIHDNYLGYLVKWGSSEIHYEAAAKITAIAIRKLLFFRKYDDCVKLVKLFSESGFTNEISTPFKKSIIDRTLAEQLSTDFLNADKSTMRALSEITEVIGNREVSAKLIPYIAIDDKDIRSHILKILTSIGDIVFDEMVEFLNSFKSLKNQPHHRDQEDIEWFIIRNMITVASKVGSELALPMLKSLIREPDDRIRIEIARSLEHISGNDSFELLKELYNDSSPKVCETAIISTGLSGNWNSLEALRNLLESGHPMWSHIINALGHLKSEDADNLLMDILRDDNHLRNAGYESDTIGNIKTSTAKILDRRGNKEYKKFFTRKEKFNITSKIPFFGR
ncbi:MAG: HEAT repeat domain-containing protein [candidate division Zixibacteria bacterium]|nr:HEAT repeat domain-containing protein [candidate division Zixibacteria bacterium]